MAIMLATQTAATSPATTPHHPTRLDGLRQRFICLQAQARDVDENIADLTHTYARMAERSDWSDPKLPALDETITYWKNRYRALVEQVKALRAEYASALLAPQIVPVLTPIATQGNASSQTAIWDMYDIYAGQRGAQPIIREAM